MAHNNGKISAPVSIKDVQVVLGESISVLAPKRNITGSHDLCGSPNINIWSRIKPCKFDSLVKMQPHDFTAVADPTDPNKENIILTNQTLTPITDGTTGIIFPQMLVWNKAANLKAGNGDVLDAELVKFRHDFPTGWDGTHLYASRLADFDGYDHNAPIPFTLKVSLSETTFTATIGLNTDNSGVLAKTFDYNIYKNVIWRLAVAVGTGSSFTLYINKDSDTTRQHDYLYSNGFLGTMGDTQKEYTISGEVGSNTTYNFVGMLIGYKVTQTEGSTGQPITDKVSPIWASATDNSRCGIPMPCAVVSATSGIKSPSVAIISVSWMYGVPMDEGNVIGTGSYAIYADVTWDGGSEGGTFRGYGITFEFSSGLPLSLKIATMTIEAYQKKTVRYYCMTDTTGAVSCRVAMIRSGIEVNSKKVTLNIKKQIKKV